jgi:hypothetical protein
MLNRIYHIRGTLLTLFFCFSVLKLHPAIEYNGLLFLFYMLWCIETKTMDLQYPFVWFCIITIIIICTLHY